MTPIEKLQGLRGAEYFDAWKTLWSHELRGPVNAYIRATKDRTGRFTIADLVTLANAFQLPFKTLVEQLEKDRTLPNGTYNRLPPIGKLRQQIAAEAVQGETT